MSNCKMFLNHCFHTRANLSDHCGQTTPRQKRLQRLTADLAALLSLAYIGVKFTPFWEIWAIFKKLNLDKYVFAIWKKN